MVAALLESRIGCALLRAASARLARALFNGGQEPPKIQWTAVMRAVDEKSRCLGIALNGGDIFTPAYRREPSRQTASTVLSEQPLCQRGYHRSRSAPGPVWSGES
jgi:hypothetical protein